MPQLMLQQSLQVLLPHCWLLGAWASCRCGCCCHTPVLLLKVLVEVGGADHVSAISSGSGGSCRPRCSCCCCLLVAMIVTQVQANSVSSSRVCIASHSVCNAGCLRPQPDSSQASWNLVKAYKSCCCGTASGRSCCNNTLTLLVLQVRACRCAKHGAEAVGALLCPLLVLLLACCSLLLLVVPGSCCCCLCKLHVCSQLMLLRLPLEPVGEAVEGVEPNAAGGARMWSCRATNIALLLCAGMARTALSSCSTTTTSRVHVSLAPECWGSAVHVAEPVLHMVAAAALRHVNTSWAPTGC